MSRPRSVLKHSKNAAAQLGFSQAIIEKDFCVCLSLDKLFALPSFGDHLIFKGGTSPSKPMMLFTDFRKMWICRLIEHSSDLPVMMIRKTQTYPAGSAKCF